MKVRKAMQTALAALIVMLAVLAFGASTTVAFKKHTRILESASFSQPETYEKPTGLAVDQETGNVYVADSAAGVVDVFGPDGGSPLEGVPAQIKEFSFGGEPAAVAVDDACYFQHKSGSECALLDPSNGDVYVAEAAEHAIAKFKLNVSNHEYELVGKLTVAGSYEPNGVAVDTDGNVYVANFDQSAITEFSSSGVEIGSIEQGIVSKPGYVAVGPPGTVYVGSYEGANGGGVAKLEVNSKDEVEHQTKLNNEGKAVAVDSQGNVFVDDGSYMSEYSPSGSLREEFGSGLIGVVSGGTGVAVNDKLEYVYVSSEQSKSVLAFAPLIVLAEAITGEASDVQSTSAMVVGEVNPENLETSSFFEYGPCSTPSSCSQSAFGETETTFPPEDGSGGSYVKVAVRLSGLEPNQTYHYRLVAHDEHGNSAGEEKTFQTSPIPPEVEAQPPAFVTSMTAILSGNVNPENAKTSYRFEYGACETLSTCASTTPALESATYGNVGVLQEVSGLQPATTYHYRLVATNEDNETTESRERMFTTATRPVSTVVTGAASGISQFAATIFGTVDPNGVPTTYRFELGTDAASGIVAFGEAGSGSASETVAVGLAGLQVDTTYHYRLVASNTYGTVVGAEETFTTLGFSLVIRQPISPLLVPMSPFPTIEGGTASSNRKTQLTCRTKAKKIRNARKRRQALMRCAKPKPKLMKKGQGTKKEGVS